MPQVPIVPHGNAAAIVLPESLLQSLGLRIGDMVDVSIEQQHVTLRPDDDSTRRHTFQQTTQEILDRRQEAYQRLA